MCIFLELCEQKLEANNSYLVFLMKNTLGYGLANFSLQFTAVSVDFKEQD